MKTKKELGRASRSKGKRGEREVAQAFRAAGYQARRAQQYSGIAEGGADVVGVPGLHIECKRVERLNLSAAYIQSRRDAEIAGKAEIPIVVHRKSREDWMVTISLADFITLIKGD